MKGWLALLIVLVLGLQYKLWFSDVGVFAERALQREWQTQQESLAVMAERNEALTAQALALKRNPAALEERARRDLGMIKQGEVFYFVPERSADR